MRFQINSNGFSRDRSLGHKVNNWPSRWQHVANKKEIYAEPLCRVQNKLKFLQRFLEIIPRRLQGKIPDVRPVQGSAYIIDVLWGQPIKLVHVVPTL